MTRLNVRYAKGTEVAPVSRLLTLAYAHYRDRIPDLPDVSAGVTTSIAEKNLWVATQDNSIVGVLVLVPGDAHMILENVAVHPDHKGAGVGKILLEWAEARSVELGFVKIKLSTHKDITENISLYEHLGWRISESVGNKVSMEKLVGMTQ